MFPKHKWADTVFVDSGNMTTEKGMLIFGKLELYNKENRHMGSICKICGKTMGKHRGIGRNCPIYEGG